MGRWFPDKLSVLGALMFGSLFAVSVALMSIEFLDTRNLNNVLLAVAIGSAWAVTGINIGDIWRRNGADK